MNLKTIDLASVHVSKRGSINDLEYSFDYTSLKIYLSITDSDNLLDLYNNSGKTLDAFEMSINKLFDQELIYQVFKIPTLKPETMEKIKQALAIQVGPLASLIISEAMQNTGIINNAVPVAKTKAFINAIIIQIPKNRVSVFIKSIKKIISAEG